MFDKIVTYVGIFFFILDASKLASPKRDNHRLYTCLISLMRLMVTAKSFKNTLEFTVLKHVPAKG